MSLLASTAAQSVYPNFLPDSASDALDQAMQLAEALNDPSRTDTLVALYEKERDDLEVTLQIILQLNQVKPQIQKRLKLLNRSISDLQPTVATPVKSVKKEKTISTEVTGIEDFD
jgi:hypothetical protein